MSIQAATLRRLAPITLLFIGVGCHGAKTSEATTTDVTLTKASVGVPSPNTNAPPPPASVAAVHFDDAQLKIALDHPPSFTLSKKPDGVFLKSEPLANVEDPSDGECVKQHRAKCIGGPTPMTISISIRAGDVLSAWKATDPVSFASAFPTGRESSFKPDLTTRKQSVDGRDGYRSFEGAEATFRDFTYARLVDPTRSLEVECTYVGDLARPSMSRDAQIAVCDQVLASLHVGR